MVDLWAAMWVERLEKYSVGQMAVLLVAPMAGHWAYCLVVNSVGAKVGLMVGKLVDMLVSKMVALRADVMD